MHVTYNSFIPAWSVTLAASSDEESLIAETVEEIAAIEAFELSGEELAYSHSMHFKHGGMNSPKQN